MKKSLLVLAVIVFALTSCSDADDVDTKKPEIDVVSPQDHDHFHPGEEISFICNFTDDTELASYKIDIHSSFDGHEHSAQLKSGTEDDHEHTWDYEYDGVFASGATSERVEMTITIPEEIDHDGEMEEVAAGDYHFGVYCLDMAGNQQEVFIEIEIEHEDHE